MVAKIPSDPGGKENRNGSDDGVLNLLIGTALESK